MSKKISEMENERQMSPVLFRTPLTLNGRAKTFFKSSAFVFKRRKKIIPAWNAMRVSK